MDPRDTTIESTIEWWVVQAQACLARTVVAAAVVRPVVEDPAIDPDHVG